LSISQDESNAKQKGNRKRVQQYREKRFFFVSVYDIKGRQGNAWWGTSLVLMLELPDEAALRWRC
jgi:hypothetical protein